jgi:ElaB/YqjD/DUF883 family membrane-anchored ribosome-binding protein
MPTYNCECCNFSTLLKSNYNNHIKTNKHIGNVSIKLATVSQKLAVVSQKLAVVSQESINPFKCKYCDQCYKHKSSLSKHIKYSCTKNKTEDLTELVRLLNLQLEQQKNQLEHKDKQLETQSKQIEKLMDKLEINNTYNTINVTNNISLLNYKDTDMSHITDIDYRNCIKNPLYCVLDLIEKIHFNPQKPENMNMYIPTLKEKYIMMYEDNKWMFANREKLKKIYENNEDLIEEWYNNNKDDKMKLCFGRYLNMKDEEMAHIMDELKLLMFNNKDLVIKQKNSIKN